MTLAAALENSDGKEIKRMIRMAIGIGAFSVSMLTIYALLNGIEITLLFLAYQNATLLLVVAWLVLNVSTKERN